MPILASTEERNQPRQRAVLIGSCTGLAVALSLLLLPAVRPAELQLGNRVLYVGTLNTERQVFRAGAHFTLLTGPRCGNTTSPHGREVLIESEVRALSLRFEDWTYYVAWHEGRLL